MTALDFKFFDQKLLVIGPIYDQVHKVANHPDWFDQHDLVIFNGNICYPNNDLSQIRDRIEIMNKYLMKSRVIYNLGDQDLILMKRLWETGEAPDIHAWIQNQSNAVIINFAKSQSHLIVTAGGVTPEMSRSDLQDNLEISFVSYLGGRPWHAVYGGGAGYVIANNPLSDQKPRFYPFSLQIGTNYNPQTTVYAVQAHSLGIGEIFYL